jgi:glutaredoxin
MKTTPFTAPSHLHPMLEEMELVLITSPGCHLCERARVVLTALSITAREIDLSSQEACEIAASGVPLAMLPVLWNGERVLAYGRFSERALRRRLGR